MKPTQFHGLTSLRFFAAVYVVLLHYCPVPDAAPWLVRTLISRGFVSVSFFYMLSGFVLAHVYRLAEPFSEQERKRFWFNRFARIYPAYLLGFLAYAPYVIVMRLA